MPEVYSFIIYLFIYLFIHSFILTQTTPYLLNVPLNSMHVDTPYTFVVTIFSCLFLVKYEALL